MTKQTLLVKTLVPMSGGRTRIIATTENIHNPVDPSQSKQSQNEYTEVSIVTKDGSLISTFQPGTTLSVQIAKAAEQSKSEEAIAAKPENAPVKVPEQSLTAPST